MQWNCKRDARNPFSLVRRKKSVHITVNGLMIFFILYGVFINIIQGTPVPWLGATIMSACYIIWMGIYYYRYFSFKKAVRK
ncbi:MAG: hypothetical protein ACPGO5_00400 [Patescibacteria group bacterium]